MKHQDGSRGTFLISMLKTFVDAAKSKLQAEQVEEPSMEVENKLESLWEFRVCVCGHVKSLFARKGFRRVFRGNISPLLDVSNCVLIRTVRLCNPAEGAGGRRRSGKRRAICPGPKGQMNHMRKGGIRDVLEELCAAFKPDVFVRYRIPVQKLEFLLLLKALRSRGDFSELHLSRALLKGLLGAGRCSKRVVL